MHARWTRGPSVGDAGVHWVVGKGRGVKKENGKLWAVARFLYTPPKQRLARARALPNAGPFVS
jgi:hypothetical protein